MPEELTYTQDKFTFHVATDRYYNAAGVWAKAEGNLITVGVSDFFQQHNGDVAFVDVAEVGTAVSAGDEFANIETIKVDISFSSPLSGKVAEVNPLMDEAPEVINQDPYGGGWLAVIIPDDWEADRQRLLDADAYFIRMQAEAQDQIGN